MIKYTLLTLVSILCFSCNNDNSAPTISLTQDYFCAAPGEMIELDLEIEEENTLSELRLISTDLDFIETIDGSVIEDNGGIFSVILTVADNTIEDTYELNIQAIDDSDNISNETIIIKVQS